MKNKNAVIIPLMLGTFMAALDNSIVNISLPVMQKQFKVEVDDIQWVITAYMLAFCVFMPLTNWLKDKIGLYKMYLISICVFICGSVLCGLAPSLSLLLPARILQALGGGALTPVALAMLSSVFTEEERGKVMGWWGLGVVVGPALGPTLGGALTQYFGWPSIFFVNIPFGVLAFWLSVKYLKEIGKKSGDAPRFDMTGFIFFTLFIVLFQYSIARIEKAGFASAELYLTFVISLLSLFIFIETERRKDAPLLDLSLFTNGSFVSGILVTMVRSVALFGGLFLLPFLLQGLMGYSELETGLLLLPASAAIAALMPVSGKWSDKHGARAISIAGLILIAVSTMGLGLLNKGSSIAAIVIPMVIRGIGLAFLFSPISAAIINSVPNEKSATASSFYSLFMQVGGSIGISIIAVLHQYLLHHYQQQGKGAEAEHIALQGGFFLSTAIILLAVWPALKLPKTSGEKSKATSNTSRTATAKPT